MRKLKRLTGGEGLQRLYGLKLLLLLLLLLYIGVIVEYGRLLELKVAVTVAVYVAII